jgi:hypothetical protein
MPSLIPRSLATLAMDWPGLRASWIASDLNSGVNWRRLRADLLDDSGFTEDLPMVVIPSYQMAPLNPGNFTIHIKILVYFSFYPVNATSLCICTDEAPCITQSFV